MRATNHIFSRLCGIVIGLLLGVGCWGQTTLTLDSCLQLAAQNNHRIRISQLEVEKADAVKQQALTKYFPQVSASAMGYHSLHPMVELGVDDIGNASVRDLLTVLYGNYGAALGLENTLSLFQYGYQVGVTAMQPVFMGGKIVWGNQLAALGVEVAELQAQIATRDVLQEVEESYWLVFGLQEKQATLLSTLSLLDTLHQTVSAAVRAGLVLSKDLLQVELQQSEMRRTQIQLTHGLQLAEQALCLAIGIPYSDTLTLHLTTHSQILPSDIPLLPSTPSPTSEHELLDLQVRAAKLQRRMALAEALPQVAVGAQYGYGKLQANLLRHDMGSESGNGAVFVAVSVPLTAWWESSHQLRQKQVAIQQAELQQEQVGEQLHLRTQQAYHRMHESAMLIDEYQKAVDIAAQHYRLSQASYRAGQTTMAELLQAHTLLLQSHNNLTDAYIAYRVNTRRYHDLVGK